MNIQQEVEVYKKDNIYDLDNSIMLEEYSNRIVSKLIEKQNIEKLSLLELGLGHGYTAKVFDKYFKDYTILEGDKRVIDKYIGENPNTTATIKETYFETFETNKRYDVIIMGFVLEHVENPVAIMQKYAFYLKTEGRLFAAVPNAEALNRRIGKEAGLLGNIKELSENDIKLGHRRYYDVDSLENDIEAAGLEVINMEGIFLKPFTTKQLLSLNLSNEIYQALCKVGREYPELCLGILAELKVR